jgi:FKBP-type peptidyl-prolyl cis-trans isomerase FkpA
MNKFFKILFVIAITVSFSSCNKDDDNKAEPLRDYTVQYAADIDSIDDYLDTHYMEVDADFNVTYTEIPEGGTQQSIRLQTDYPLDFVMVNNEDHDVNYKVYYIKLREGLGRKPTEVDSVHVAYRGTLINDTQFDLAQNPIWFQLQEVVPGWSEIIPKFKTAGTYDDSEGPDPVDFQEYGAGVMFLPSGLGYYGNSSPSGTIAGYSPLIFSFKLMELRYKDHDRDGILSKDEGDPTDPTIKLIKYDSDGDGTPNLYDVDDDGDHFLTKNEIKNPITGNPYPFADIPTCTDGKKKHLSAACH